MKITKSIIICAVAIGMVLSATAPKASASTINERTISAVQPAPVFCAGGGKDGQETHG